MRIADVSFTTREGALIAALTGEIDMSNAEKLGVAVIEATPSEVPGVVLDFSQVNYIDSAGIYAIYGLRERLRVRGQRLRLMIPGDSPVNDALRLAGVEQHVQIARDLDSAVTEVLAEETAD